MLLEPSGCSHLRVDWAILLSCLIFIVARNDAAAAAAAPGAVTPGQQQKADLFATCPFPDLDAAVKRFSKVLAFKTVSSISSPDHVLDRAEFRAMDAYLSEACARVWTNLKVEKLGDGGHSYLITWQGSNPALRPALFISHLDVVPITPGTEQDWKHPPFSGAVADGFIWGRGALDVKIGVVGLLEAANALLADGFKPVRTLLMAFGQDEESTGFSGAAHIAAKLAAEGVRLEFIWDEGGTIYSQGLTPLTTLPVALVGTAEKLSQQVSVTLTSPGGHSSMPPVDNSSISARLGSFLSAMTASPPPPKLEPPVTDFLQALVQLTQPWLSPTADTLKALFYTAPGDPQQCLPLQNALNSPARGESAALVDLAARASAQTAAQVRDTVALTMVQADVPENVLPQTAQLSINFRLLPGTPASQALSYVQQWLGPNATWATASLSVARDASAFGPSKVTDTKGYPFKLLTQAIQEAWKLSQAAGQGLEGAAVPVLPYLMPGGTDSKHYQNLTDANLRFGPYSTTQEEPE